MNMETVQKILMKIRRLLVEESQLINDVQLTFYIEKLVANILAYCNLDELPVTLEYTVIDLVLKRMNDEHKESDNDLKSLEMGDTKFTFNTSNINSVGCASDADFNSIKSHLNLFVKVKSL